MSDEPKPNIPWPETPYVGDQQTPPPSPNVARIGPVDEVVTPTETGVAEGYATEDAETPPAETPPAETPPAEPEADADGDVLRGALPDDFPGRAQLAEVGINTYGQLRKHDDVTDIAGIGPATAEKIEAALSGE